MRTVEKIILKMALTGSLFILVNACDKMNPSAQGEPVEVGIYNGQGAWDVSVKALTFAVRDAGYEIQEFNENDVFSNDINRFQMIIIPGGDPEEYSAAFGSIGLKRLKNFVDFGGGFFGVGGGAAIADIDSGIGQGIGLFDGDAVYPIDQIAPYPQSVLTEIVKTGADHEISRGGADRFTTLYRWGPYFLPYQPANLSVIFTYFIMESPALVSFTFGFGRVVLVGCQLEIEENDNRDGSDFGSDLHDPDSEWELIDKSIQFCLADWY